MMSRSNSILLIIGVTQWVALCSLWKVFEWEQLYFIAQALFILSLSIVLLREFNSLITEVIFFFSLNQIIDEITMEATEFRFSEYLTFFLVMIYLLLKKNKNDRKNRTDT